MRGDFVQAVTAGTLQDAFPEDAALLEDAKAQLAAAKIGLAAAKERALKSKQEQAQRKARQADEQSKPKAGKQQELPRGIRRRGNSLQIYLTHPDGRVELRSLGRVTPKFAEKQRVIYQREIAEARYMKPAPRIERVLFTAIADAAYERAKNQKRFWDSDCSRIERLKVWWSGRYADEITTAEIDAKMRKELRDKKGMPLAEATWNEYRTTVIKTYKDYMEMAVAENAQAKAAGRDPVRQELPINPGVTIRRFKLHNERTRELTYAEEDRLRAAIRELFPEKEPEFDLALHTGMRRSNIYGTHGSKRKLMAPLDWSAVNLDFKVITLPRSKPGPGYNVPLNETALAALKILRQRSDGTGPVARKPSGLEIHSCRKWFEQCIEKAAIPNLCWHDLRHSFATRLRRNRVPLEDIAALLGHDLRKITLRYAHADMDRLHEAVATLVVRPETVTKTGTPSVVAFSAAKSA